MYVCVQMQGNAAAAARAGAGADGTAGADTSGGADENGVANADAAAKALGLPGVSILVCQCILRSLSLYLLLFTQCIPPHTHILGFTCCCLYDVYPHTHTLGNITDVAYNFYILEKRIPHNRPCVLFLGGGALL